MGGRRLRPDRARDSALAEQSFAHKVPVVFRLTSGITQVSGHFGGGGVSAWNHPDGRSLRHTRNTRVPPKMSGEYPPHACVLAHTESGKSIGVSALVHLDDRRLRLRRACNIRAFDSPSPTHCWRPTQNLKTYHSSPRNYSAGLLALMGH